MTVKNHGRYTNTSIWILFISYCDYNNMHFCDHLKITLRLKSLKPCKDFTYGISQHYIPNPRRSSLNRLYAQQPCWKEIGPLHYFLHRSIEPIHDIDMISTHFLALFIQILHKKFLIFFKSFVEKAFGFSPTFIQEYKEFPHHFRTAAFSPEISVGLRTQDPLIRQ